MSTRRDFLKTSAVLSAGSMTIMGSAGAALAASRLQEPFQISLAEWSLQRTIFEGELDHLDFPGAARRYGIDAAEYVNQFFRDRANDTAYLAQMQERCEANGIRSLLDAGYRGYVGIEYEGDTLSEEHGIGATRNLLARVQEAVRDEYAGS